MIELVLSMTFISFLLIAIATITIHMSNAYTKGVTLRVVNQAGQVVSSDLTRTIGATLPFAIPAEGAPVSSVPGTAVRLIDVANRGGRLCTGAKTYAWNYAASFKDNGDPDNPLNRYTGTDANKPIRLIRVSDPGASLCTVTPLADIAQNRATELLASGDRDLVIHTFTIVKTTPEPDTNSQALYKINLTIGTSGKQGAIDTVDQTCKSPSEGDDFETYCAVNKFELIVRAGNVGVGN